MLPEHEKPWQPRTPPEVARLFADAPFSWWLAGGYAIELAGGVIRPHGDIDIMVLRPDSAAVRKWLPGWEYWAADPPGTLRPWLPGEHLPAAVHDIWCRDIADAPWQLQLMIDEVDEHTGWWRSRRDGRVTRQLATIGRRTKDGIPYIAPEIQLYYKARGRRTKDELDFNSVLSRLDGEQRAWLRRAIVISHGELHPWLSRLEDRQPM